MFYGARSFNQPLNEWNVSNVTTWSSMFDGASSFNQPLNEWNVSNVTTMHGMFNEANFFQSTSQQLECVQRHRYGPICFLKQVLSINLFNNWNVSNVTIMHSMFYEARSFNQPLNNWNVSNVTDMENMFYNAISFNQPLNNWNVSNVMNNEAISFHQPSQ